MATGVGLGIWVMVAGYSPVPFADFWGQFPFLERAVGGDLRIADLWAQANEHRILIPRLEFLVDYRLFDGTNVFLFSAIAVSSLLLAAALGVAVQLETGDQLLAWGTFCVSAIATMSPVMVENLNWAFQVQFVQVFLFAGVAILAVVAAARTSGSQRRHIWTAASAVAGIAATYSLANGLLVWPVVLLFANVLKLGKRATALLGALGALTYLSYLWHYEFSTHNSLSHPLRMLAYVAIYLGSMLRSAGTTAAGLLGGLGIMLFVLLCLVAWKRRLGRSITTQLGTGLALFVLLTAVQTASGRLSLGLSQALSSRYATGSFVFWLGLTVGFLIPASERFRQSAWIVASAYLGAAALIALVVGWASMPTRASLHATVAEKEITVLAYRVGVNDPGGTFTGGPSGPVVSSAFRWMQRRMLGPWARGGMVDGMRFTSPTPQRLPRCRGGIESIEPVGGGIRLRGWLAPPDNAQTSENVAVLDATGTERGLGLIGTYRPDVKTSGEASSDWTGLVAYTRDRAPTPLEVVLIARDRRTQVCRLQTPL
jgi:hypothetical protein